ncbi:MAG TPA: hypothetical protein VHE61_12125 [Opitutaceae bacterium]|nr:hypothetical protein [Opitutaceae bacterium]
MNTHLDGVAGWNTDPTEIGRQIAYLGVRLERDWPSAKTADGLAFHRVQQAGNPLLRLWLSVLEGSPATQRASLDYCRRIYGRYGAGLLYAVGGPNEEDDPYPQRQGARLPDSARVQQLLYDWAHPLGLKVNQMEFGAGWTAANQWQGDYHPAHPGINDTVPANGDQQYRPGPADFGGSHPYLVNRTTTPAALLARLRRLALLATPGKPVAHTEIGGYARSGLSPAVFGRYLVMGAFDSAAAGDAGYLVYGLQDGAVEGSYGFFTADGRENPVATYFHTLTTLLQCSNPSLRYAPGEAATFVPGGLDVSFANTTSVSHFILQKPTGEYVIAVYSEQLMNGSEKEAMDTVHFGKTFPRAEVYDVEKGTTPITTQSNASSCTLTLLPSDTYLIVLSWKPAAVR